MARLTTVKCSKCGSPVQLEERSLRRYYRTHESDQYICQACINRLTASRPISVKERTDRSQRAKKLWGNREYRDRVRVAVRQATADPEFKKIVSDNSKERWRNEEYRKKMELLQNDPKYRAKLSKQSQKKWEDEEYRRRVLESKFDRPTPEAPPETKPEP